MTVADITITQEDLDQRIADAVASAAAEATAKFSDYEAIKTQLSESKKAQESEVERQVREAREAAAAELPAQLAAATSAAKLALVTAELRSLAAVHRFKYPEDVIDHLGTHKDLVVTDDFKVKGAEKLVKELAEARPEWLVPENRWNGAPPRDGLGGPNSSGESEVDAAARLRHRRQVIGVTGNVF